ncbi:MAG: DUF2779 domain-containing protein [Mycoplasmataceae bacterium]|nr:DUF2779 domain-containing protein [Mycoplasmataceae bacterium]
MEAKKPKFIRKSDFFNYFIRPRDQWFYLETDLIHFIENKIKFNCVNLDEEEFEHEYDSLESLRLSILNGDKIDEHDPKVYEGRLIDEKSREFIKLKYLRLSVYDFDELYSGINDLNYLANETKNILIKDNFILFQPVFIYRNKVITRPDVLIKEKGEYTIIEVKATTKPKTKHLVDLIYQHHVINGVLQEFNAKINHYLLCVINYTKGIKGKVDFVLTNHIPLIKDGKNLSDKAEAQFPGILKYSDEAVEARRLARLDASSDVTIQNLMQIKTSKLEKKRKKLYDLRVVPLLNFNNFEKIIDELCAHIPQGEPSLEPDIEHFNTWFDDYKLLHLIRKYYFSNNRFLSFHWSGKVMRFEKQYEAYKLNQDRNETTLQNYMLNLNPYNARYFKDFTNTLYTSFNIGVYRTRETKELFSLLKPKKVYFDFETINPATCVIDDTTPYTQIVTQVSIIKDNLPPINIVVDPQNINVNDLKNIIDQIYNGNDCSYIVYNKSFECNRLKEMAVLINDSLYTQKIQIINQQIYDLCIFFIPAKDLITIRELAGFFSIKNILPIVQRETPEIFQGSGAIDYHALHAIHHGGEALNKTSRRFFGLINDQEWIKLVEDLKAYCENDVRAMIAVEQYIKHLIDDKN